MKYFILGVVTLWAMVMMSEPALAQCTTQTIFMPDGRVVVCQTCGGVTNCF